MTSFHDNQHDLYLVHGSNMSAVNSVRTFVRLRVCQTLYVSLCLSLNPFKPPRKVQMVWNWNKFCHT